MRIGYIRSVPVRILIDGYSLLHSWPELAPEKPRHSSGAREELIFWLTRYRDAIGTPITVIFDGAGAPTGTPKADSTPEMEIIFSGGGQTADDLIERAAHRLSAYGEVLVVTDDLLERDTAFSVGAMTSSCFNFIQSVRATLSEMEREVKNYNRREQNRFKSRNTS